MEVAEVPILQRRVERELDDLEQRLGEEAREVFIAACLCRGIRGSTIAGPDGQALSDRERFVLIQYAIGRRMKMISRDLGDLSIRTIETYLERARRKLGIRGRGEVIRFVFQRGWASSQSDGGRDMATVSPAEGEGD